MEFAKKQKKALKHGVGTHIHQHQHHLAGKRMRQADLHEREFQFQTKQKGGDHHHNALFKFGKLSHCGVLHVHVCAASGVHGKSSDDEGVDTYVRVQVDRARLHTATVKHSTDPDWGETFVLPVATEQSQLEVTLFFDRCVWPLVFCPHPLQ